MAGEPRRLRRGSHVIEWSAGMYAMGAVIGRRGANVGLRGPLVEVIPC